MTVVFTKDDVLAPVQEARRSFGGVLLAVALAALPLVGAAGLCGPVGVSGSTLPQTLIALRSAGRLCWARRKKFLQRELPDSRM
jgi:hypothetical protein